MTDNNHIYIFLGMILFAQYVMWAVYFFSGSFKSYREMILDAIPFYTPIRVILSSAF